jgi:tRNA(adenine34) deaminase
MTQALDLAKKARQQGEVPVGAILVGEDNKVIATGWNQAVQNHDASAHAEIIAIREAGFKNQNYRLNNTTLYATLEPCCMCAGAIVLARIKRLVFATRDVKAGAAGSVYNLLSGTHLNHRVQIDDGYLQQESSLLLKDFFQSRR